MLSTTSHKQFAQNAMVIKIQEWNLAETLEDLARGMCEQSVSPTSLDSLVACRELLSGVIAKTLARTLKDYVAVSVGCRQTSA